MIVIFLNTSFQREVQTAAELRRLQLPGSTDELPRNCLLIEGSTEKAPTTLLYRMHTFSALDWAILR